MSFVALTVGVVAAGAEYEASSSAASSASKAQQRASNLEQQGNAQTYQEQTALNAPYLQAGQSAITSLLSGFSSGGAFTQAFNPGDFNKSADYAGYDFERQQGNAAGAAAAAAGGRSFTPGTAIALQAQNQGLAATSYRNWADDAFTQWNTNRATQIQGLEDLSGIGQSAASTMTGAAQNKNTADNSAIGAAGNAQAAADVSRGKALSSAIGSVAGDFQDTDFSSAPPPSPNAPIASSQLIPSSFDTSLHMPDTLSLSSSSVGLSPTG